MLGGDIKKGVEVEDVKLFVSEVGDDLEGCDWLIKN